MDGSPSFISTPIPSRRAALLVSGRGEVVLCDQTHNMIRLLNVYKSNYQLIIIWRENFCHCNCYVMVIIEVINQSFVCYLRFFSKNECWLERVYARIGACILYWLPMSVCGCAHSACWGFIAHQILAFLPLGYYVFGSNGWFVTCSVAAVDIVILVLTASMPEWSSCKSSWTCGVIVPAYFRLVKRKPK